MLPIRLAQPDPCASGRTPGLHLLDPSSTPSPTPHIVPSENLCPVLASHVHLYSHRHSITHTHTHRHVFFSLGIMSNYKYSFIICSFSPNNTLPINSAISSAGSKEKQVSAQTMWEGPRPAHPAALSQEAGSGGGASGPQPWPGAGAGPVGLGELCQGLGVNISQRRLSGFPKPRAQLERKMSCLTQS